MRVFRLLNPPSPYNDVLASMLSICEAHHSSRQYGDYYSLRQGCCCSSHTKAHTARPVDVVLNLLSPFIFIFTLVERVLEKKKTTENVTLSVIFGADE
jgi:hypothetical protein